MTKADGASGHARLVRDGMPPRADPPVAGRRSANRYARAGAAAHPLLEGLDAIVEHRVLVFGALPPEGADVDLLARPGELATMARWLAERGYLHRGDEWSSLSGEPSVDLVPADAWRLPSAELQRLFDEAEPIPGFEHLVRPASHHALLIAAHRVARDTRALDDRRRKRLNEALERDPDAWRRAEQLASAWGARAALELLGAAHGGATTPPGLRVRAQRVRWAFATPHARRTTLRRALRRGPPGGIVAFSGIDGSGKSSQAHALRDALERLGVEADVVWPPSQNLLFRTPASVKRPLRRLLHRLGQPVEQPALHPAVPSADVDPGVVPLSRQTAPLAHALATVVALVQVVSLRRSASRRSTRGRVVIFDRYALDATVYLRQRWGHGRPLRFQSWLVRTLARRPLRSYWLDLPPERAFARKQDYPLEDLRERAALYPQHLEALGVRRLDAERPRDELSAAILREVWACLSYA